MDVGISLNNQRLGLDLESVGDHQDRLYPGLKKKGTWTMKMGMNYNGRVKDSMRKVFHYKNKRFRNLSWSHNQIKARSQSQSQRCTTKN